ncbi:AraC family transcriptional regulator [Mycolicibacterium brumae]|uniref:AraC family transcriptional regulator n=1 Tax=Mycolicibacterium brumae TaxID=85968 RepID=A0A2G5P8H8_9MYCO|nr:AraC family transcriptional regulator [Mycolicibacterium brumae]PIB74586.1 AraC family transcriptional regulator [Mycolicibacterium brumae]
MRSAVGYQVTGAAPGTHLGIPSPTVTLVVDLGPGLDLEGPGLAGRTRFRVCLGGLHHEPYRIVHDGSQIGVQLELTPDGVRSLFGLPVAELSSQAVELADLAPEFSRELIDRVSLAAVADRASQARQTVARHLGHDDDRRRGAQPDAAAAWRRIVETGGRISVTELTERSGWSTRYLTTRFTAEYGMGPKQAARLVRFDGALTALRGGAPAADVAARHGYADQAHLSRDVRAFLGMSPSEFLTQLAGEFTPATASVR